MDQNLIQTRLPFLGRVSGPEESGAEASHFYGLPTTPFFEVDIFSVYSCGLILSGFHIIFRPS